METGGGLYLVVRPSGTKAWVQRIVVDGRRRDIGIGGFPIVSLARAREKATANRIDVANGRDPLAEKRKADLPTFREAAEKYITVNQPRWRHWKTPTNWRQSLERYAYPVFGSTRIDRIARGHVLLALEPIWTVKPAIARKLRQRIRAVFAYAMAHGHIEHNPGGEVIDAALPPMPAVKSHLRALPYQDVGDALKIVAGSKASLPSKLCFQFLVLTAARSGEARGATWAEIDLQAATWIIAGSRMKAGAEHRVPLSAQAIGTLKAAHPLREDESGGGLIFPSATRPRKGTKRYDADKATARPWTCRTCDCARIQDFLQDVVYGANRHPLGRRRVRAGTYLGQFHRGGLRPFRSV